MLHRHTEGGVAVGEARSGQALLQFLRREADTRLQSKGVFRAVHARNEQCSACRCSQNVETHTHMYTHAHNTQSFVCCLFSCSFCLQFQPPAGLTKNCPRTLIIRTHIIRTHTHVFCFPVPAPSWPETTDAQALGPGREGGGIRLPSRFFVPTFFMLPSCLSSFPSLCLLCFFPLLPSALPSFDERGVRRLLLHMAH
jgi:hypothetical protein